MVCLRKKKKKFSGRTMRRRNSTKDSEEKLEGELRCARRKKEKKTWMQAGRRIPYGWARPPETTNGFVRFEAAVAYHNTARCLSSAVT